jgi:hypothetical protein
MASSACAVRRPERRGGAHPVRGDFDGAEQRIESCGQTAGNTRFSAKRRARSGHRQPRACTTGLRRICAGQRALLPRRGPPANPVLPSTIRFCCRASEHRPPSPGRGWRGTDPGFSTVVDWIVDRLGRGRRRRW